MQCALIQACAPLRSNKVDQRSSLKNLEVLRKALKFQALFSINCWLIKAGIHEMFFRIANREDPDQTASSEAV